jgi:hypothetical protein
MDFRLAAFLMIGCALTYFLSRVLWHWRQGSAISRTNELSNNARNDPNFYRDGDRSHDCPCGMPAIERGSISH